MFSLLKLEFVRLFNRTSFYVCIGLILVFNFLPKLIAEIVLDDIFLIFELETLITSAFFILPKTCFTLVAGTFIAIVICDDYKHDVIKNLIVKGFSKWEFFISKIIVVFFSASAMFLIYTVSDLILFDNFQILRVLITSDFLINSYLDFYWAVLIELCLIVFTSFFFQKKSEAVITFILFSIIEIVLYGLITKELLITSNLLFDAVGTYIYFMVGDSLQGITMLSSPLWVVILLGGSFLSHQTTDL